MKSSIRLFRALPVKSKEGSKEPSKELLEKTIRKGFIFSPNVLFHYSNYDDLIRMIEKEVGLTPEQLNASFHKSWEKIKTASIEQLVLEQIIHYFTTYGFEALGIYDKDSIYIPNEQLDIPELEEGINLVVIKGLTKDELKEKLSALLSSGIALSEDTIKDVMDVAVFTEFNEQDVSKVRNKEVKAQLYEYLDLVPSNPTEFLRYIIYRTINKTLLIKNEETVDEIKTEITNKFAIVKLFKKYEQESGLEKLAEIFLRFKPLFLAFRANGRLKPVINRIRRLTVKNHKPMIEDYLNIITSEINRGEGIDFEKLNSELNRVTIFRKIRLAYALKFRLSESKSIIYRVRNGKSYVTDFVFSAKNNAEAVLNLILQSIINDISKNVKGKKIYIPEYINYTLPATEKQFTGNFPNGTYVTVPRDIIVGVNWNNVGEHRIDLDLSLISAGTKYGWDSYYRSEDRDILFSGDMTDASRGATELFYVQKQNSGALIMFVNYFNHDEKVEVPFKIIVASEKPKSTFGNRGNYMINPNNLVTIASSKISRKQRILGLLVTEPEECRFYFTETDMGNSITSYGSDNKSEKSKEYLLNFYTNSITLNDLLVKAGAEIVADKKDCNIDLTPESLEKDTILSLLQKH